MNISTDYQTYSGYTPEVSGYTPRAAGYTPEAAGYTPEVAGYTARAAGYTARAAGYTAKKARFSPDGPPDSFHPALNSVIHRTAVPDYGENTQSIYLQMGIACIFIRPYLCPRKKQKQLQTNTQTQ
ncbi:MAG: hypothetical protein LBJ23_08590 [Tannerella sp.]|jgi:hypothetical protein|nr:hypothetical protein [Tannerella sp.]